MSKKKKEINKIKATIIQTGILSNNMLEVEMTEQDVRRVSDKINELQEILYAYLYIKKHGMV